MVPFHMSAYCAVRRSIRRPVASVPVRCVTVDNADVLLGPVSSALVIPTEAVAAQYNKIFVEGTGGSPQVFARNFNNVFFVQPATVEHQADPLVNWIKSLPADQRPTVAGYPTNDDPFAQAVVDTVQAAFEGMGIKTGYKQTYPPTQTDFTSIGTQMKAAKVDILVQGSVADQDAAGAVKGYSQVGFQPKVAYFASGPDSASTWLQLLSAKAAEGTMTSLDWLQESTVPGNKEFVDAYLKLFPNKDNVVPAEAAEAYAAGEVLAAAIKAIRRFMATMHVLSERWQTGAPVAELLQETLQEIGYLEALEAERTIEAQGRIENLQELVNVAVEYDASDTEGSSLPEFLQQIALIADADSRTDDEGLVTLMTLHNAKGLEYPIVFIIGLEEGVFPHSRALDEGGLEEERRLCYVGITRAERDLYFCYARTRTVFGARSYGAPSRFLGEVPVTLTDRQEQSQRRTPTTPGGFRERLTSWGEGGSPAPAPVAYRLGDDVVHPSFGDGVVTGVEAGGIVVIHFSRDRSARKLVADLAPISKR